MRTFGVFRVEECVLGWSRGDNRQARSLIYSTINSHRKHQQSDADEWRGNEMKNDKSNQEVKEKGL